VTIEDAEKTIKDRGIELIFAQSVDLAGTTRAKLVPADHLRDLEGPDGGAFFAGFAAYGMGQAPHHPDLAAVPDWDTLTVLPWAPHVARFACDVYLEGQPYAFCSRSILKGLIRKLAALGYQADVGLEPEFYLVRRTENGLVPFDDADSLERPCYDMRLLTRSLGFLQKLVANMKQLGWDVLAVDHEDANGQFEVDYRFADALTTADRYVFFRDMGSIMAHEMGGEATFMPKPWTNKTGNGAHFHLSLSDPRSGENLFLSSTDELGLNELAYSFIGGVLAHSKALSAITAPTVNSYKRMVSVAPTSGATWAPVAIVYGGNNRTQLLRIPGPGRVENRAIDSACNPYLAAAAIFAAGLDGIQRHLSPGRRNDLNIYDLSQKQIHELGIELMPSNLKEAVEHLSGDAVLREALGSEFVDYYVDLKTREWASYHNTVSQWEIDRYLNLY
jgi:glutamine synthetase